MPKHAREDETGDDPGSSRRKIQRLGAGQHAPSEDAAAGGDVAAELLSSLTEQQIAELLESPQISSAYDAQSIWSSESDEEIPYKEQAAPPRSEGSRPIALIADRGAARRSALTQELQALPQDVRQEYLGPNFDFGKKDALAPYELELGVEHFSRISWPEDDLPNVVIELHPHLYVGLEKFKEIVACIKAAGNEAAFSGNLWKRFALVEAPPYRTDNFYRGLCKQQQAQMDEELSGTGLLDLRKRTAITSKYMSRKLVDARTYMTIKQLTRKSCGQTEASNHLAYVKSTMNLETPERLQLTNFNNQLSRMPPPMLARKGDQTFISGEMVKASCELLRANIRELHSEEHIQLMAHFPTGGPTGEYRSLFTHAKGNFANPSRLQAEQLGLPSHHEFRKENSFEQRYQHRDHFYGSMKPNGVNARLEQDKLYMYRQMDFDTLLESDYHKVRLAVSLLEDGQPLDLSRCEKLKTLLGLDEGLRYRGPEGERPRDRDAGRS